MTIDVPDFEFDRYKTVPALDGIELDEPDTMSPYRHNSDVDHVPSFIDRLEPLEPTGDYGKAYRKWLADV